MMGPSSANSWLGVSSPIMRRFFEGRLAIGAGQVLAHASRLHLPKPLLKLVIHAYADCFRVDMTDVLEPAGGFGCFGDFFARRLRPGARPFGGGPGEVIIPCDAVLLERGPIEFEAQSLVIKGFHYTLSDLVGDATVAAGLAGGEYTLMYLHPRDYHRVHAPVDGTLIEVRHMRGARYPMAPWASKLSDGALAKNERVAFDIELALGGRRCVLLMVAAFGVGGIESSHLPTGASVSGMGRVNPHVRVTRGDDFAAFRIGSSVVLLWPPGTVELNPTPGVGDRVTMGQSAGRLSQGTTRPGDRR